MIRIAAVGDVHYGKNSKDRLRYHLEQLKECADLFLIAGDLTQSGLLEEAKVLAQDLSYSEVPVVVVLGNHDYHNNEQLEILSLFQDYGVIALEGQSVTLEVGSKTVGVMGLKGFGGGFVGACISEFGEPETKAFARHCKEQADILRKGLESLNTDYKFALTHFSPVESTLLGEKKEIYPFLGSYLLAEAIDSVPVTAAFHGHAHLGVEKGETARGVPVRNVAQSVIKNAYKVYLFQPPDARPG